MTQSTGYAITALGHVASSGGKARFIKDIAEATGLPHPYLAKIIHTLARRGLAVTRRGVGGGVALAREPGDITLYDIAYALDDPLLEERCMLGTAECSDERACPAHAFWTQHRKDQIDFLRTSTLADVAAFERRQREQGAA
ncbi:MAG: Rrf2 family transcriptional regulator [Trueperaceae bacterium]|nr:MAG: Rrf2 family transcriptional regulator [Trueperaceae bacterium]